MDKTKLNMHSMIDAITNSSTETYSQICGSSIDFTYKLLQNVIDAMKIEADVKEFFDITMEFEIEQDELLEYFCNYIEEIEYDKQKQLTLEAYNRVKDKVQYVHDESSDYFSFYKIEVDDQEIITKDFLENLGYDYNEIVDRFIEHRDQDYYLVPNYLVITPKNDTSNKIYADFLSIIDSEAYCG